jgi:hypothetical protein
MSKTVRRLLIAALVSAAGFASTITWYKLSENVELGAGNLKPIARLVTTVNDVQKKQVQKLIWQPAVDNEVLHVGEAIRTAPNAEARIEFLGSATAIDLEPDSAIVLEETDGKLSLDFLKGNIMVKADTTAGGAGGDLGITLKSGDKNIALGKSEVSLGKSQSGDLDLQVLKGTVNGLDANSLTAGQIKILSPLPGDPIYINTLQKELAIFKWQPLPAGYEVFLESGDNRTDLKPVAGALGLGDKGELRASIKPGKAFFRLVAKSADGKLPEMSSMVMRTSVLAKIPPQPLSPEKDSKVAVNKVDPDVQFLWANPAGFTKLILEIASTPDLKQIIKTERLENATSYTFKAEKSATLYWRVSGVLDGRTEVVSSPVQKFNLSMTDVLVPPELELPKANARIPAETIKKNGLMLSWKAVPGADRYRIIVEKPAGKQTDERTPAASEKVFEEEGKVLQVSVPNLKPGNYTWTVASVGKDNTASKFADKRQFSVQTLPVIPWADGKTRDDYYYISLKPSVGLKWEKGVDKATSWTVKVYRANSDINPVTQKFTTTGGDVTLPEDGLYRAEVEAFDDLGNVVARSATREVKVAGAPLLPGPQFADGTPKEIEATGGGAAQLKWQDVQGASQYVVQIQSKDGKDSKDYNFTAKEGSLKGLMPGEYKISLRSVDQNGRMGPPGDERVLKVPAQSNLRAPKLKGMKVK